MKSFLTALAVFAGAAGLFAIAFIGFAWTSGTRLKGVADDFVRSTLPKVFANGGDVEAFWESADQRLRDRTSKEEVREMFRRLAERLGQFQRIESLGFQGIEIRQAQPPAQETYAAYRPRLRFEKGSATLDLKIVSWYRDPTKSEPAKGGWYIGQFVIDEDARPGGASN